MNILKNTRLFIRRFLRDLSKWYIERYGYFVIEKKNLYDWQISPNFNTGYNLQTKIPKDAKKYLHPNNSRLVQLKNDYQKFLTKNFKKGLWTEDYLKSEDLLFFRGDNPYLYQKRGNQLSIFAYLITYFWFKSNYKNDRISLFNEENSFGVYNYVIDEKNITRDLLDSLNEITFLKENVFKNFENKVKVLEIGAGYGRLAKWLTKNTKFIEHYYCIDGIPESTFISEYFLKKYHKIDKVTVVPIDRKESLTENDNITLAINIHSFSEMSFDFVKFWIKELTRLKVLFLFIVPNAGHKYKGDLLSFDKVNFKNLLESNGYELILKRAKYLDPYVQKYGLNPTIYYLFKNINFMKKM